jgi:hypothetical protein
MLIIRELWFILIAGLILAATAVDTTPDLILLGPANVAALDPSSDCKMLTGSIAKYVFLAINIARAPLPQQLGNRKVELTGLFFCGFQRSSSFQEAADYRICQISDGRYQWHRTALNDNHFD